MRSRFLLKLIIALAISLGVFSVPQSLAAEKSSSIDFFAETALSEMKRELRAGEWSEFKKSNVEMELVEKIENSDFSVLTPRYTENGLVFILRYDKRATQDPRGLVKNLAVLHAITCKPLGVLYKSKFFDFKLASDESLMGEFLSPHIAAEILSNAEKGSPVAKLRWAQIQLSIMENTVLTPWAFDMLNIGEQFFGELAYTLRSQEAELVKEATRFQKTQLAALEKWKKDTNALSILEAKEKKLNDLILKNDRVGVRKLIETYLPWPLMEPTEASAWKVWLEAIEKPDPSRTIVGFRGVDYSTDKVQRSNVGANERLGFMSTVLTKNQGNYTRRLRSLTTNRLKNGDRVIDKSDNIPAIKITSQMYEHAREPVASSFISFTPNPGVAARFVGKEGGGGGGFLVAKIDSRRMIPNLISKFGSEIEYLVPLVVFPDEVIAYREGSFKDQSERNQFFESLAHLTGINYQNGTFKVQNQTAQEYKLKYSRDGYEFFKKIFEMNPKATNCSKIF